MFFPLLLLPRVASDRIKARYRAVDGNSCSLDVSVLCAMTACVHNLQLGTELTAFRPPSDISVRP